MTILLWILGGALVFIGFAGIVMSAVSAEAIEPAKAQITELLRMRHHILPGAADDFNLRNPTAIAETVAESARTMEVLLASVASVSLLIGGVGIMNIMLVSVTERTREMWPANGDWGART